MQYHKSSLMNLNNTLYSFSRSSYCGFRPRVNSRMSDWVHQSYIWYIHTDTYYRRWLAHRQVLFRTSYVQRSLATFLQKRCTPSSVNEAAFFCTGVFTKDLNCPRSPIHNKRFIRWIFSLILRWLRWRQRWWGYFLGTLILLAPSWLFVSDTVFSSWCWFTFTSSFICIYRFWILRCFVSSGESFL